MFKLLLWLALICGGLYYLMQSGKDEAFFEKLHNFYSWCKEKLPSNESLDQDSTIDVTPQSIIINEKKARWRY